MRHSEEEIIDPEERRQRRGAGIGALRLLSYDVTRIGYPDIALNSESLEEPASTA